MKVNLITTKNNIMKIGDKIHFYKEKHQHALHTIESIIVPAINEVVNRYEALGIGKFNKEVFTMVITNNTGKIKERLLNTIEKNSAALPQPLAAIIVDEKRISALYAPFQEAVNALHNKYTLAVNRQINSPEISLSDCIIEGSEIIPNTKELENRFSIFIESENQIIFYKALLKLKECYDEVSSYMKENGLNTTIVSDTYDIRALSWENEDGSLYIDPVSITLIK